MSDQVRFRSLCCGSRVNQSCISVQLDDENAESMYSRLNALVNEINSLGVKQIEDLELIRKILHSLRRPDYDLVTTILYEKDLEAGL